MDSFTIELFSNASAKLISENRLNSFTNIFPEQLNLEGQGEVASSEKSYPSMYQNVTERKFLFFEKKHSKLSEFLYRDPGVCPSNTDIVENLNTLVQERHNHNESCITVQVSRRTQNEGYRLALFIRILGHIFDSNVGNELGVMLRGKGPHKPKIAYEIFRIHFLLIEADLIEYNVFDDTKTPLLRCFLCISKVRTGDLITAGQYMKYQTFINWQFRPLLKNSFHSIHTDLRDTSGEKNHLYLWVSLILF